MLDFENPKFDMFFHLGGGPIDKIPPIQQAQMQGALDFSPMAQNKNLG